VARLDGPEKNISIMIEDMVLVTDDGHEVLSAGAPTSSAEIERLMNAQPDDVRRAQH